MKWTAAVLRSIGAVTLLLGLFASPALAQDAKPFTNEQLDQMTAQIALYPDSLLRSCSWRRRIPTSSPKATAWSKAHPDAKGDDAVKMVENEGWDPSVASMVAFPEVLITLGEKTDWVKNMGDAFLAQPEDVMDSVQRLRAEGAEGRQPEVQRAGEGVDAGAPSRHADDDGRAAVGAAAAGDRDRAGAAVGRLRAGVQPGGGLWRVAVSGVSAVLLPDAAGLLVFADGRHRHRLGRRHRRVQRAVGRLQLGPRRRQHQRQPLQQHQHQQRQINANGNRQLESQHGASRQHAVPRWRRDAAEPQQQVSVRQSRAVPRQGREPRCQPRAREPDDAEPRHRIAERLGARPRAERWTATRPAAQGMRRRQTATPRGSRRRAPIATRRASARNRRVATTRCAAPTAGRRARRPTAARRASAAQRSAAVAAAARAAMAAVAAAARGGGGGGGGAAVAAVAAVAAAAADGGR